MGNILTVLSPILPALTQDLVPITYKSSNALRAHCISNRVSNYSLSMAERTGSPVFQTLWSYVLTVTEYTLLAHLFLRLKSHLRQRDIPATTRQQVKIGRVRINIPLLPRVSEGP